LVFVDRPICNILDSLYGRSCLKDDAFYQKAESLKNEAGRTLDACCYRIDNSRSLDESVAQLEKIVQLMDGDVQAHLDNLRLLTVIYDDWVKQAGETTLYFRVPQRLVEDRNKEAVAGTLSVTFPSGCPGVTMSSGIFRTACECSAMLSPTVELESGVLHDTEYEKVEIDESNLDYLLSFYFDADAGE
jgi:hypothetical protein